MIFYQRLTHRIVCITLSYWQIQVEGKGLIDPMAAEKLLSSPPMTPWSSRCNHFVHLKCLTKCISETWQQLALPLCALMSTFIDKVSCICGHLLTNSLGSCRKLLFTFKMIISLFLLV